MFTILAALFVFAVIAHIILLSFGYDMVDIILEELSHDHDDVV